MPEGWRIRPAVIGDALTLATLIEELNSDQGEELGHVTAEAVRRDGFGAAPEFRAMLAEMGGQPVGYALFHPSWSSEHALRGLYLNDLYVREAARGRGVGRALLAAVAAAATAEGRSFLWWTSQAGNSRAQGFYRDLGAIQEPVGAHALFGAAFDRLAAAAADGAAGEEG